MTRNGKIARLPAEREQLNRRLDEAQQGDGLLEWLNGLPEVQALLPPSPGGRPLGPDDLSEWIEGGYRDGLAQRQALEDSQRLAAEVEELQQPGQAPLTDMLARFLTAQMDLTQLDPIRPN